MAALSRTVQSQLLQINNMEAELLGFGNNGNNDDDVTRTVRIA